MQVYVLWVRTFVARTMAPRTIRSRTRVTPNDSGSSRDLTRFKYTSVTKSAEILDCEETITEPTKCANFHRSPPLGGAPRVRVVVMDETSRAKVPTCKGELQKTKKTKRRTIYTR